jgi:hypothetical protein
VRGALCSSRLLSALGAWLDEALRDRQLASALGVLHVLAVLPAGAALLRPPGLGASVAALVEHGTRGPLADAARAALAAWDAARGMRGVLMYSSGTSGGPGGPGAPGPPLRIKRSLQDLLASGGAAGADPSANDLGAQQAASRGDVDELPPPAKRQALASSSNTLPTAAAAAAGDLPRCVGYRVTRVDMSYTMNARRRARTCAHAHAPHTHMYDVHNE